MTSNLIKTLSLPVLYIALTSNIRAIDVKELQKSVKGIKDDVDFILENEALYSEWHAEWPSKNLKKADIIGRLSSIYEALLNKKIKTPEVELLLGEIAHYLYNLGKVEFSQASIEHYRRASQLSPKDYRSLWFLGYHYAQYGDVAKAIDFFNDAEKLSQKNQKAEFWMDYGYVALVINMPTNCLYAMDRAKAILGEESTFGKKFRTIVKERIVPMNSNTTYSTDVMWKTSEADGRYRFLSRPLGIKFYIDGEWGLDLYDYSNQTTALTISPKPALSERGQEIGYSITLLVKVSEPGESLNSFVNDKFGHLKPFETSYSGKLPIKYPGQVFYHFTNPNTYADMGGGVFMVITFERQCPQYPGLVLERDFISPIPKDKTDKVFRPDAINDRFGGKIYYILMLDTCADICEEAMKTFIEFFDKALLVE